MKAAIRTRTWPNNIRSTLPLNDDAVRAREDGVGEMDEGRREFLKTSAKTVAGIAASERLRTWVEPRRVLGASDRVRIAICGLHGRGVSHIERYAALPNAEIAALCDVDDN